MHSQLVNWSAHRIFLPNSAPNHGKNVAKLSQSSESANALVDLYANTHRNFPENDTLSEGSMKVQPVIVSGGGMCRKAIGANRPLVYRRRSAFRSANRQH